MSRLKNVKPATLIRTTLIIVVFAFLLAKELGFISVPLDMEKVMDSLTASAATATALWGWWRNNSFTEEAIQADEFMAGLRSGNGD